MITPVKKQYPERVTRLVTRQLLAHLPEPVFYRSAELFLNQKFKNHIHNGELDFLDNKRWVLDISDASRRLCIQLQDKRIKVTACPDEVDLTFKGPIASFITLALKEQDPDSLFFNRQLSITGDTALGLEIKNFIDRLPLEDILTFPLSVFMRHLDRSFNTQAENGLNRSA